MRSAPCNPRCLFFVLCAGFFRWSPLLLHFRDNVSFLLVLVFFGQLSLVNSAWRPGSFGSLRRDRCPVPTEFALPSLHTPRPVPHNHTSIIKYSVMKMDTIKDGCHYLLLCRRVRAVTQLSGPQLRGRSNAQPTPQSRTRETVSESANANPCNAISQDTPAKTPVLWVSSPSVVPGLAPQQTSRRPSTQHTKPTWPHASLVLRSIHST